MKKKILIVVLVCLVPFVLFGGTKKIDQVPIPPMHPSGSVDIEDEFKITLHTSPVHEGVNKRVLENVIDEGPMVIFNESLKELPWIISDAINIDAPVEKTWAVESDFANFPKWVPSCAAVKSEHIAEGIDNLHYTLGFKFIFLPLGVKYSVRHYHQPNYQGDGVRSDWVGLGGTIERTYGYFLNIPTEDKSRTMYFYTCWARPGSGILKRLSDRYPAVDMGIAIAPATVYSYKLKDRVENKPKGKSSAISGNAGAVSTEERIQIMEQLASRGPVAHFKVLDKMGGPMEVSTWIIFNQPREEVWNAVSEFDQYKYIFASFIDNIKVQSQTESSAKVDYKMDVDVAFFRATPEYTLQYDFEKPSKMTFTNIKGNKYVKKGSWEFFPIDGGKKTLACYKADVDMKELGMMVKMIAGVIPEATLAINTYVSAAQTRDLRDWITTPEDIRSKIKSMKREEGGKYWNAWREETRLERLFPNK